LHRWSTTPVALLANTAMLDAPTPVALPETNPKSSNVTPVVSGPCTCSAYPAVVGASVALSAALYVHCEGVVVQFKPPYAFTPSREVPTTRFSAV
jgi:hypothetical protein